MRYSHATARQHLSNDAQLEEGPYDESADSAAVAAALDACDLVGTLDRFNEFVVLLSIRLGIRDIRYQAMDPNPHKPGGKAQLVHTPEGTVRKENVEKGRAMGRWAGKLPSDLDEWKRENLTPEAVALVKEFARADAQIYDLAKKRLEEAIAAEGEGFRAAFAGASLASKGGWFGGPPAPPLFQWARGELRGALRVDIPLNVSLMPKAWDGGGLGQFEHLYTPEMRVYQEATRRLLEGEYHPGRWLGGGKMVDPSLPDLKASWEREAVFEPPAAAPPAAAAGPAAPG
mmetsp:Transcript_36263/g.114429  ORF Transcript_36263/g.114429 Transcript_36263/m.114429 type:complete len:287 (+) Transcript_36263:1378-2238(+)